MVESFFFFLDDDEAWLLPQHDGVVLFYVPLRSYLAVFERELLDKINVYIQQDIPINETKIGDELKNLLQNNQKTSIRNISYSNNDDVLLHDLSLALSNRCNLECVYCHSDSGNSESVLSCSGSDHCK